MKEYNLRVRKEVHIPIELLKKVDALEFPTPKKLSFSAKTIIALENLVKK